MSVFYAVPFRNLNLGDLEPLAIANKNLFHLDNVY